MKENETCQVYDLANRSETLATIVLNGYNISGDGPLGLQGQMRSFKLVKLYFPVNRSPKRKPKLFQSRTLEANLNNVGLNQPD